MQETTTATNKFSLSPEERKQTITSIQENLQQELLQKDQEYILILASELETKAHNQANSKKIYNNFIRGTLPGLIVQLNSQYYKTRIELILKNNQLLQKNVTTLFAKKADIFSPNSGLNNLEADIETTLNISEMENKLNLIENKLQEISVILDKQITTTPISREKYEQANRNLLFSKKYIEKIKQAQKNISSSQMQLNNEHEPDKQVTFKKVL